METLTATDVRRLALARAGLMSTRWSGLPVKAAGGGAAARRAAHALIQRFGYLQLDTVSVAGVRSQSLFLLSRLKGVDPRLAETLLRPGEPLFEYWGHEVSYLPLDLYPCFRFARSDFKSRDWVTRLFSAHGRVKRSLLRRVHNAGPIRSAEMEGTSTDWWGHKHSKQVAIALWSIGKLAIRERVKFQRAFDVAERVIPAELRNQQLSRHRQIRRLVELAFDGHG